jgi:hypothetical protein
MTPADATLWISGLVAIGGLAIAGFSQWLIYRERKGAYQLRIYDKQLEALQELSIALAAHFHDLLNLFTKELFTAGPRPLSDDAKARIRSETALAHNRIGDVEIKWQVVLPDSVTNAIQDYRKVAAAVTAQSSFAKGYDSALVTHKDPSTPLSASYGAVVQAMRRATGTDKLSQSTLRMLIGRSDPRE